MFLSDLTMKLLMDLHAPSEEKVALLASMRADEEAARPVQSAAAKRQAKYRANKASQAITDHNAVTVGDEKRNEASRAPLSRPLPPQTPLTPTHSPGDINLSARPAAFAKPNGFARFWEAYPNKVGKRAAETEYERALKRIAGPDPPSVILAGVERAKASREWGEGFIPHPKTWLHQDRWADEPAEITQLQPRKAHERAHPDAKFDARQANLARHDAGADLAARLHRQS